MEKYKIERDSVQETLVIPLYGRKMCTQKYPALFTDKSAAELCGKVDYDFAALENRCKSFMYRFGILETAMRQYDLTAEVKDYLNVHSFAAVVNLGCGLDNTGRNCDNGKCKIYNIDLPDVIAVRNELLPAGEREQNIVADINDTAWFERIDDSGGAVFIAAGVFYYFTTEKVIALLRAMSERFVGGRLAFDSANRRAVKLMLKTWIRQAAIGGVDAYFAVSDAVKELSPRVPAAKISSRGYMLGYHDLKGVGVNAFFRWLSRIADGFMGMRIVRMDFD